LVIPKQKQNVMIFPNTIIALTALLFNANQAHAYGDRTGLCTDDVQAMAESVMGGKNDLKIGWQ
jgi:hypothetical protein